MVELSNEKDYNREKNYENYVFLSSCFYKKETDLVFLISIGNFFLFFVHFSISFCSISYLQNLFILIITHSQMEMPPKQI